MAIRVYIVDDHPLAIEGLHNILKSTKEFIVSGTFSNGNDLLQSLELSLPDILLMDILLPDCDGITLMQKIKKLYPDLKVVAITSLDAPIYIKSMLRFGCKGYILKNTDKATLVSAIKAVYAGEEYIQTQLKEKIVNSFVYARTEKPVTALPMLTKREKEVLELIMTEMSSHDIAEKLFLSIRTIESHRFNLYKKLNVNNTVALVKTALSLGLTKPKA